MKRPTIQTLAEVAGVSVSTVNRTINHPDSVRKMTRNRILQAAREIGFYGLGSIEHSVNITRRTYRIGILLLNDSQEFYQELGAALQAAAAEYSEAKIGLQLEYLNDLSSEYVADRLVTLGRKCDAVAVVAAEHPLLSAAAESLQQSGVPVTALISPLTARSPLNFVGLDNWKVGRTAAWFFDKMCRKNAAVGVLIGSHRYRSQDLNESGFRSYMREHGTELTILESDMTNEMDAAAFEITRELLRQKADLGGLYISGGGIKGAVDALRESRPENNVVCVGYELINITKRALIDGVLTVVISHPFREIADKTIRQLVQAKQTGSASGSLNAVLDFNIYTSENITA